MEVSMTGTIQESAKKNSATTPTRSRRVNATTSRTLTHDDIALRAHTLYIQSGYQGGREVEFWLEAERQLREELDL